MNKKILNFIEWAIAIIFIFCVALNVYYNINVIDVVTNEFHIFINSEQYEIYKSDIYDFMKPFLKILDGIGTFVVIAGFIGLFVLGGSNMTKEEHEQLLNDLNKISEEQKRIEEEQREMYRKREIEREIDIKRYKRNKIRTDNTTLDYLTGDVMSQSKLKHNQKIYDKYSDEINELEDKLNDFNK